MTEHTDDPRAPDPGSTERIPSPGASGQGLTGKGWTQPDLVGPGDGGGETADVIPTEGGERVIEGDVRGFRERIEQRVRGRPRIIWTFRVERYDDRGNRLMSVPVTMQSRRISGYLSDGNRVQVRARRRRTGDVRATKVRNLTTGSDVIAGRFSGALVGVFVVLVLAAVGYGGFQLVRAFGDAPGPGLPTEPAGTVQATDGPGPTGTGMPSPEETGEPSPSPSEEPSPSPEPDPPFVIACDLDACLAPDGAEAADVTLPVGTVVEWRNDTDQVMKVYLPESFGNTGEIAPGESLRVTLAEPGAFDWEAVFASGTEHLGRITAVQSE